MASEFKLGGIVPWGRTAAEYEAFFALAPDAAPLRVLDCGGGPASFAAEWAERGHFVVSVDPLYLDSPDRIRERFEAAAGAILQGMQDARARFDWAFYGSPEAVVERRRSALAAFLADLEGPLPRGRYVAGGLPGLPFRSASFDLVLCSHLLFLYSDEMDQRAHVDALLELLRVGREVRVFPLMDLDGRLSRHLGQVMERFNCERVPVPFQFQRGATEMLRLEGPPRPAEMETHSFPPG